MTRRIMFDASDLINNISKDVEITQQMAVDLTAKTTLDAHADLVKATPVDTGQARQGWEAETPTKFGEAGTITNNVEHIVYLNDGHSKQAPENFVETIVDKYNRGEK